MDLYLKTEHSADQEEESTTALPITYLVREGQSLVFGRNKERSDVVITGDDAISGTHFRITCGPDTCQLEDLESRNQTIVNGQPVSSVALSDGDHVSAGDHHFFVQLSASVGVSHQNSDAEKEDSTSSPNGRKLILKFLLQADTSGKPMQWLFAYLFPKDTLSVGRLPDRNTVGIPSDVQLSGTHLEFALGRHSCRVTDLESTNGSILNGLPFTDEEIESGDEIVVGRTYIVVVLDQVKSQARPRATVDVLSSRATRKQGRLQTRGYRIVNESPLRFAPLLGRIGYPNHSMTLIVKGTFQFQTDKPMTLADEQIFPDGDVPYADAEDPAASIRYENDFSFAKPNADVLLVGHCHAPGGEPVEKLTAGFRVGELSKSVDVHGIREWKQNRWRMEQSSPEPFSSLELRYEHAFGGPEYDANLVGVGHLKNKLFRSDDPIPMPQIVPVGVRTRNPEDTCDVAGFGPQPKYSGRRLQELGTYDKAWETGRWPWFPTDFSWDHYNAAPEDQRIDGFLRGDEEVELKNLHPDHSTYNTALPGLRVRCFVNPFGSSFFEVSMSADTLWLDVDAEQAVLVWRGHFDVESEECRDIRHVYIMSESLDEEPLSVSECHSRLLNQLAQREAQFQPPAESPPASESETVSDEQDDTEQAEAKAFEEELARIQKQVRDAQVARGIDPAVFDKQVQAEVSRIESLMQANANLPPAVAEYKFLKELWDIQKRVSDAKVAAGQQPDPLPPEPQPPPEEEETKVAESKKWTRDKVEKHYFAGGSFAGADLSGLDLAGLKLSGAEFQSAILSKTRLAECDLSGCNLTMANVSGSDLSQVQFANAILNQADFSGAILHEAVLTNAAAVGTIFSEAWLTGVMMTEINASHANLSSADLTGSDLSKSTFDSANLTEAKLNRCNFSHASMQETKLGSAVAREACFDHAQMDRVRAAESNLTSASLRQVIAPNSIWEGATLRSADLSYSQLPKANFISAVLNDANLSATDLTLARLSKAVVKRAKFIESKLFEADLDRADLRGSDISGSCLFGAQLNEVQWSECKRDSVNWKMTQQPVEELA